MALAGILYTVHHTSVSLADMIPVLASFINTNPLVSNTDLLSFSTIFCRAVVGLWIGVGVKRSRAQAAGLWRRLHGTSSTVES